MAGEQHYKDEHVEMPKSIKAYIENHLKKNILSKIIEE